MSKEVKLITTEDGSHSVYRSDIQESYHSFHGAYREAIHVFMLYGLEAWASRNPGRQPIRIFELGFGTGLNAWLSLIWAEQNQVPLLYHTIEPFPLEEEVVRQLNYTEMDHAIWHYHSFFNSIHKAAWNTGDAITPYFNLKKEMIGLEDVTLYPTDIIYFDAFSPQKQPELWEFSMLEKVVHSMNPHGVFVTYCASSKLKKDLDRLGLVLDQVPGPPGKKEMTRAWNKTGQ